MRILITNRSTFTLDVGHHLSQCTWAILSLLCLLSMHVWIYVFHYTRALCYHDVMVIHAVELCPL